jgi:hypothetical protein
MTRGSCLCGAVRYEIAEPLEEMHHCHCGMCRKAHGAAFSTFARTRKEALRLVSGEDKVRTYRSSAPVERRFCVECGSSLFFAFTPLPDAIWVAVGSMDGDPEMRPQAHIFVGSKASWHPILDDLPQFPEYAEES